MAGCLLISGKDDHLGFTVLVDMRDVNWSVVSAFVDRLQVYFVAVCALRCSAMFDCCDQGMSCVSVYRAVVLRNSPWLDKFRLFIHKVTSSFKVLCTLNIFDFVIGLFNQFWLQFTVVQSIKDLHRQIDPQELTLDYGGSLPYSHSEWIDMRKVRFVTGTECAV